MPPIGWNPELVLFAVVLPNSTNLAVVISKSSIFGTLYAIQTGLSLRNCFKLHLLHIKQVEINP